MNPAPMLRHQRVSLRLGVLLDRSAPPDLEVVTAPFDWRYDETNVVEPDLLVCHRDDLNLDDLLRWPSVPVLLVEIFSPSNIGYDRLLKRELYERLGVPSYWMVDPGAPERQPSITELVLDDAGAYTIQAEVSGPNTFTTEVPYQVSFAPEDLLGV